jgi:hypothetical protein
MTINRSALRRNTAKALMDKIKAAAASTGESQGKDERFWQPTVDSNGNGFAVIRFLPSKTEETLPFVKTYSHGFKVGSKWFIDECPTTIGEKCPVCEANSELWNSGFEDDKKIVRERKRRLRFVSNILVIKDPKNPENEGKVFLFGYGQKIFDKLTTAMNPPEEYGEEPRDPFGFFDGCVVKLKIKNKDGYRNYDDTTVEPATDLYDGDEEKLMDILEKMHDIQEFLDPKLFKSFEDLETRFKQVTGQSAPDVKRESSSSDEFDGNTGRELKGNSVPEAAPEPPWNDTPADSSSTEEDDDLAFFRKLASDD